ncbi:LysM peptidoglycan-binding domain-containing M23 family metallopeptidase [Evansella sp. AB-rgal1]|uniref:LysM peptidoglycan-binding domain-containing M23 family metallopeptidase n=1 Tax=Evansella sp. AB-rgal1 TaxID=3242696 RepID=UPI00359EBC81
MNVSTDSLTYKSRGKFQLNKLICLISVILLFSIVDATKANANEGSNESLLNIKTIYHVYYGMERVGIVDDTKLIENYKQERLNTLIDEYKDLEFSLDEEFHYIPERVFFHRNTNNLTLHVLDELVKIHAETYEVKIGENLLGHISRDEDLEDFVRTLKHEYVTKEELETFEDEEAGKQAKVGTSVITDIYLSEEIEWNESLANPKDIFSIKDAIKILQQGTLEAEIYTVKQGDVLGSIAADHNLSMNEIKQINPGITEDSLLRIGDDLNVTVLKPMISVIVEKEMKKEETISYQTETKDDSEMWQGTSRVAQEGKDGKKVIEYKVTYENGRSVKQETVSEEIITEPINKVVVRGTKTSPSRGSGQLSWPAVGGYISSYQGMRWGRYHRGIDIARPSNFNILAADNGTVKSAGWENGYGNTIRINHNNGMETMYAHLASINVRVGQTVGKGQTIGRMGSTGNSTGIHLHFEVYQNGQLRNPMDFLNR